MATVTLNRTTKVLKIDLTNMEFLVLDALIQTEGPSTIEAAMSYLIQSNLQTHRERKRTRIRDRVQTASDTTLDQLDAAMGP